MRRPKSKKKPLLHSHIYQDWGSDHLENTRDLAALQAIMTAEYREGRSLYSKCSRSLCVFFRTSKKRFLRSRHLVQWATESGAVWQVQQPPLVSFPQAGLMEAAAHRPSHLSPRRQPNLRVRYVLVGPRDALIRRWM